MKAIYSIKVYVLVVISLAMLGSVLPFAAITPAAATTKVPAPYDLKAGSLLNVPKTAGGSTAQQRVFENTFKKILDATPTGETITVSMYSTSVQSVADKVIKTYKRGVNIRYVVWGERVSDQVKDMQKVLGTNPSKKSYVIACQGSCLLSGSGGIQHAKGITVSRIIKKNGDSIKYISIVSSGNFSDAAATSSWNHTYVMTNNKTIYDSLNGYIYAMRLDKTSYDYPGVTSGPITLYYYPRESSSFDPVLDALNITSCKAPKGYGNNGKTVVRVSMFTWTGARKEIATRLIQLHKAGCDVAVIANTRSEDDKIPSVVPYMLDAGVPVRNARVDLNKNGSPDIYTHAKLTLIDGTIGGNARAIVYSGSANFTENSITDNSEIIIKIASKSVVDKTRPWITKQWSKSKPFVLKGVSTYEIPLSTDSRDDEEGILTDDSMYVSDNTTNQ